MKVVVVISAFVVKILEKSLMSKKLAYFLNRLIYVITIILKTNTINNGLIVTKSEVDKIGHEPKRQDEEKSKWRLKDTRPLLSTTYNFYPHTSLITHSKQVISSSSRFLHKMISIL